MVDGRRFNVSAVLGGVLQQLLDDRLVVDKELLAVAQLAFYHCVGEQQQAAASQLTASTKIGRRATDFSE